MTGIAIVFFFREREQALANSSVVRRVATFARVIRDGVPVSVRPRIHSRAVPGFG